MKILGIVLVVFGVLALIYQGFTYTKTDQVAKIGDLQLTAQTDKTVPISPIVGVVALVVGGSILIFSRTRD